MLRFAIGFTLAAATLACSDAGLSSSAPSPIPGLAAELSIARPFSPAASHADAPLVSAGATVTNARIILQNLAGTVLVDTVLAFPAGSDTLSVALRVGLDGLEQQLTATVQLRDQNNRIQFSGTQLITARAGSVSGASALSLLYVGPGYTVRSLSVTPANTIVPPGAFQDVQATGVDAQGNVVTDLITVWTISDTSIARIASTGATMATITPRGRRGLVTVSATSTSGVTGTARLTFLPKPASLVIVSGNGQSGPSGQFLPTPVVVELRATDGGIIAGGLVNFRALNSGGDVGFAAATTDSLGRARTTMKLGRALGTYSFEASQGNIVASAITATGIAPVVGPPTQLEPLTPIPQSYKVGVQSTQTFSAQLVDANGNYVPLAGVRITLTGVVQPGGSTSSVTVTTDVNGAFTVNVPVFSAPGTVTISLTSSAPTMANLPFGTFPVVP